MTSPVPLGPFGVHTGLSGVLPDSPRRPPWCGKEGCVPGERGPRAVTPCELAGFEGGAECWYPLPTPGGGWKVSVSDTGMAVPLHTAASSPLLLVMLWWSWDDLGRRGTRAELLGGTGGGLLSPVGSRGHLGSWLCRAWGCVALGCRRGGRWAEGVSLLFPKLLGHGGPWAMGGDTAGRDLVLLSCMVGGCGS